MPAPKGNDYAKGNKGGGRPTEYKPEYVKQAYKLSLLGSTDKDLADFFEVCEMTINNWKEAHEDFYLALKKGKEQADAQVANRLYKRALGYSHKAVKMFQSEGRILTEDYIEHYPPDTTAAIFWLKNRQPDKWRDKIQQEVSGQLEVTKRTIEIEIVPKKEQKEG